MVCGGVGVNPGKCTYWLICPIRTRFGPVPVSVAVPPMLAA